MVEPNSTIYKQQLSYRREKTKMLSVRWKKWTAWQVASLELSQLRHLDVNCAENEIKILENK